MDLLYRIKSGWTTLKVVRVALGGLILYSSAADGHIPGMVIGGVFTVVALVTDGTCCIAGQGCAPVKKDTGTTIENTDYEELGK